MISKDFKTQTVFMEKDFASNVAMYNNDYYAIGIDIGYSAVKGICPNKSFIFPAYARKIPSDRVSLREAEATDIKYRDASGVWVVGALAYDEVNAQEVLDSEAELFSRHRYYSPMFKVIARCALGISLLANQFGGPGNKALKLQTGLPPAYEKADTKYLKEVLSGKHDFDIKVGEQPWKKFSFRLEPEDILVMPQPMGAFMSSVVQTNGEMTGDAKGFFKSNVFVLDPGFGTFDGYTIKKGSVVSPSETFPEFGMREVFARTCAEIQKTYGVEILVPELQNYLEEGTIRVINREKMQRKTYPFSDILKKHCKDVCFELIEKLKSTHNYFADMDCIIATGGTYDAWREDFNGVFRDMEGLAIIPSNRNDESLSNILSNVRGYYYWLVMQLSRKKG